MKSKNMSFWDRMIRFLFATAFIAWGAFHNKWWMVVGLLLLLTVLSGRCLLYQFAGFSTNEIDPKKKHKEMRYRP